MLHAFSRSEGLIGKEGLEILADSKVAVFGLGGVGSYVVEALARAGVGNLILVDHDEVAVTNLNRQLVALRSTIGRKYRLPKSVLPISMRMQWFTPMRLFFQLRQPVYLTFPAMTI